MQYTRLGRAGVKVARICLGTMTFGREADEATSCQLMDRYVELGGNFFDTADMYAVGVAEEIVGRWLRQRALRDKIVLATKVWATTGPGPNDGGLSRLHILQGVQASLKRLQTDVIDLYYVHRWDPDVPVAETMGTLNDLVRRGLVRYIGCSNMAAWQLARCQRVAEREHWARFVCIQSAYNALNRSIESEILPLCAEDGLGVVAYNPLAGGMLTGKYRRGEAMPAGARLTAFQGYYDRYYTAEATSIVEAFGLAARERGVTPAQLALAWVLGEPRVTCPIMGARNLEQFNDTVGGLDIHLTAEERNALPAVMPGRWVGVDPVYDRKG